MSGRSKSRLLTANPKEAIHLLQQAVVSAAQLQQVGQDYKNDVASPSGTRWEGASAEAAHEVATTDEKAIYTAGNLIERDAPLAMNAVVAAIENRTATVQLVDEATSNDYTVAEDCTVTWNNPKGATAQGIADGKKHAATFTKMIADAYDKWWASEEAAQQQIDALSDSLDTIFAPIGGLDARGGMEDASALQGGYVDPELLRNLHAAGMLTPEQEAAVAKGEKVAIPANQMQYIYQFAQALEGKSDPEIAALKATLPQSSQDDMGRVMAMINNHNVVTGRDVATAIDSHRGVTDATKASFIPAAGSLANLPSSMRDQLSRTDRVTSGPLINTPGAIQASTTNLNGVGDMQDIAKIFSGAGPLMNGSEAGRAMLDAVGQYADADIDHRGLMGPQVGSVLNSDHHGYEGTAVGETGVNRALGDIMGVAGQDHVDMHNVLHDNPTDAEKFLRGITQENWGDKSKQVGDAFRWMDDDPTSKLNGESANEVGHYLADKSNDLKSIAGTGQSFGELNPGVAQGMAEGLSPYTGQLAGGHGVDNGIAAFDNSGKGTAIGMSDMFSTLDQDHNAAATINSAGRDAYNQMLTDSAQGGAHGPNDFQAAGHLANAMSLGAQDSDLFSRETAQWQQAQHDQRADQVLDNWKKLASFIPGADKPLSVGELINGLAQAPPGQNPAQIQGDQIMKMLVGDGTALSSRDYHAAILDGLAQANPNITDDPNLKRFFTNGHIDLSEIAKPANQADDALRKWFTYSAPGYGFDPGVLAQWQAQETSGITDDAWPR